MANLLVIQAKNLGEVLQGEAKCNNFVSHDPGCNSGSGVALGKFLRFKQPVSSYKKGN